MRYGFVGLGHLGRHLAANLARGGFELGVHDLERSSADAVLAAGAHWVGSLADLAQESDCLITCLPSPAATAAVMHEAFSTLRAGGTWIEMSTNDFSAIEALAARGRDLGIATLACPVTGGVHRAESGDITVLVGGPAAIFELHRAALQAMGGQVIHVGGIEQAAVTKVVTNMLAFIHLIAAGEGLMLCAKAGVDLADRVFSDRSELREQLRSRDRKPGDSQRQLRHRLHDGFGVQGCRLRARVRAPLRRAFASRRCHGADLHRGTCQVRRRGLVVDDRQASGGRRGYALARAGFSGSPGAG